MADNAKTVEEIYAAFGRGDVPAIIDRLADDVDWDGWEDNHGQRAGVPWLAHRRGKQDVPGFFAVVGTMKIREFKVLSIMAGGDKVAAELVFEGELANGAVLRDEEMHLWSFGPDGKVTRLRHYSDTAKHIAAARGG